MMCSISQRMLNQYLKIAIFVVSRLKFPGHTFINGILINIGTLIGTCMSFGKKITMSKDRHV